MPDSLKRIILDKNGNPNEHIIAAICGSLFLFGLTVYLIFSGHVPSLMEFGGAHGAIWGSAGIGQKLSTDS